MIDKPTSELIQFTNKNDINKHKWSSIFNVEPKSNEMRLCGNSEEEMEELFNVDYLSKKLGIHKRDIMNV